MTSATPQSMRQPEDSESGAKSRYLGVLRQSISCVRSNVHLWLTPVPDGTRQSLTLSERPIALRPGEYGKPLFLTIAQSVEVVPHPEYQGDFKCSTRSYFYGLFDTDDVDHTYPFLAWHWQPDDQRWRDPHVHAPLPDDLGRHQVGGKLHTPTGGRVWLEEVIRFLLKERLAAPAAGMENTWEQALDDAQKRVEQFGSGRVVKPTA